MDIPLFPNGGDFGSEKIINLLAGVAGTDGVNVDQLNSAIDAALAGGVTFQGDYNANTNTPDLVTPAPGVIEQGDMYVVSTGGTFFGEILEAGDVLISKVDDPSSLSDWSIVNKNITDIIYINDYFVSADHGSDSNSGKSEAFAFATLDAALNAIKTAAVASSIHILDQNTYTVTEDGATPGVRDLGVPITVNFPFATIVGQAGGVIFETNGDIFKGKEMNGALLEMRAKNLTSTTLSHFVLQNLYEPNWFFTQEPGSGGSTGQVQAFVGNVTDITNSHSGGIADYRTNRQGVFRMIAQNITLTLNDAARTYDFAMQGSNSAMSLQIFNNDTKNNGAGDHVNTLCTSGGRIYYRAECIGSSPFAVAENNGAGSDIYIHASDASDGGPLNYIGTNLTGIHDWSWQEGMNFAKLPANTGLSLADIINIRDVSGTGGDGQQVQATLSELQVAIGATQYTEKYEALIASPTLSSTWETVTIPGASASCKVDILIERGGQTTVGTRPVGSSLSRTFDMRESSIITVNTDSLSRIQIFASNTATTFRLIGEHK